MDFYLFFYHKTNPGFSRPDTGGWCFLYLCV